MEGGKKVSLRRFLADQKIAISWIFLDFFLWGGGGGGHPIARATTYCLLPDTF